MRTRMSDEPSGRRSLNSPVLVLNRSWTAVGTSTVRRGLVAMYRETAAGLCVETFVLYDWDTWVGDSQPPKVSGVIRTPSGNVPAPEVIVLTQYDRLHARQPAFDSRGVYIRDGYRCQYCKKRLPMSELTIDHVIPRSKNGQTSWENCVTACKSCNQKKADSLPGDARMFPRPGAVAPKWNPTMRISVATAPKSWSWFLIGWLANRD